LAVIRSRAKLDVDIVPGMRDGQRLVFRERGDAVASCKRPGHLIIVLRLHGHPDIELRNNDLLTDAPITLSEALLGVNRAVFTHLDGRSIRVRSRAGQVIRPNDVCVLRGEGLPGYGESARTGDLYIKWTIEFPTDGWLSQLDALKLSSLLPPKRGDPSHDFKAVHGKVERRKDDENHDQHSEEASHGTSAASGAGLGYVQDVEIVAGKMDEVSEKKSGLRHALLT
jgi:DnaJ family protein A protein 2